MPPPLSRLPDIAEHTESCFVADAATDEALGRFYCDNGFINPVNSVPDDAYELLDFAKVGRQMLEAEGAFFPRAAMSSNEYVLDRDTPSPQDAAKGFLRDRLGNSEAELLEKYLDLNGYGKEIMAIRNEISTEYGNLSRQDGLPVLVPDDGQEQTGMEIQF